MKKILIPVLFMSLGAVAATGFPTFWQYIESLSGSFLDNESTRSTIINEPITNGELMKANALNAKFGALKKELDSIKTSVNTLGSGSTMVSTLGCSSVCYGIVNGIAEGETVARNFLVSLSGGQAVIVSRGGTDAANLIYANAFDIDAGSGYYASYVANSGGDVSKVQRSRVTSNEFSFLGCSTNVCYGFLTGRAEGETSSRNFLVTLSGGIASIVYRGGTDAANLIYSNAFDVDAGSGYYATYVANNGGDVSKVQRARITQGEFQLKACSSSCYGFLTGKAEGEESSREFTVVLSGGTASIVYRGGTEAANLIYANAFDIDATTGYYATYVANNGGDVSKVQRSRVASSESNIQTCSASVCYGSLTGRAEGETSSRNFAVSYSGGQAVILTRGGTDAANLIYANAFDIDAGTGYYSAYVGNASVTIPLATNHPVYRSRITFGELSLGFSN